VVKPLCLTLLTLVAGCAQRPLRPPPLVELRLTRPDGAVVTWNALRASKRPALIAFATTWCEACRKERPALVRWARDHHERLDTLYLFSGDDDGEGALARQVRALQLDTSALTVLLDERGEVADAFKVTATPTLVMLDAEGRVTSTHHRLETVPEP
jgi:cytochrome c biogenesis protein CcmG, thiol:disulfide interchange protein DsbE